MHLIFKGRDSTGVSNTQYPDEPIPSERTVYRIMEAAGASHSPKRKPNGITKADRNARKSDDLLKRDFTADKPLEK